MDSSGSFRLLWINPLFSITQIVCAGNVLDYVVGLWPAASEGSQSRVHKLYEIQDVYRDKLVESSEGSSTMTT